MNAGTMKPKNLTGKNINCAVILLIILMAMNKTTRCKRIRRNRHAHAHTNRSCIANANRSRCGTALREEKGMNVKLTLDDYQILIELLRMETERCTVHPRLRAIYWRIKEKLEIMEEYLLEKEH